MNRFAWVMACAARYEEKGGLTANDAVDLSAICADDQEEETADVERWDKPEDVADADMAEWTNDGDAP